MAASLERGRLRSAPVLTALDGRLEAGAVGLDGSVATARSPGGGIAVLVFGTPRSPAGSGAPQVAQWLAQSLERGRQVAPEEIEGDFSILVGDEATGELRLQSDPLGAFPLYWRHVPGDFRFGASVAAVLACDVSPPRLDERALADYLHFGFPLGNKTLAADVRLLEPGTILTYEVASDTIRQRRYFSAADIFRPGELRGREYEQAVVDTFTASVARTLDRDEDMGLALSGGLDTRCLLATLASLGAKPQTYTLGQRGCADQVIGDRLARMTGTSHRFFELDESYLKDFLGNLDQMVGLTDGLYMTHGLTELLALQFLQDASFRVLLRGHGGELAKASLAWPFHTDPAVRQMRSLDEFRPYFFRRVGYLAQDDILGRLFGTERARDLAERALASLEESLVGVDLSPVDACSYLYLTEHHRRYTLASLEVFRSLFDVQMPFVDLAFLRVLLSGEAALRDDTTLHRCIVDRTSRSLMHVRNSNTGAPLWAGPQVERGLDKLNTVLKRLGVYGYRHYHAFDAWMRRMLLESVETILLSDVSLDRGILDRRGLVDVIEDMRRGRGEYGYLLQVLLIVELWQRQSARRDA